MSKSIGRGWGRKSTGTVTVIEARVHRSSARNARLAFWVTLITVGLLTATVQADHIHPILALFVGAAVGTITGAVVWAFVRVWPVIRLLWWWTPEITLALTVVYGFTALARHTMLPTRLAVVALVVGVPAALPWTRRRITALAWCLIVRHRIRTCFAQFIISNRAGSLPLILLARPTPVGERVWVYLRPGLSLTQLQARLDQIAVACHAATVTIDRASERNAAFLRLDVKRRDALTDTIASPVVDLVDPATPTIAYHLGDPPTALDLPDVPNAPAEPATTLSGRTTTAGRTGTVTALHKPAATTTAGTSAGTASRPAIAGAGGADLSDWID